MTLCQYFTWDSTKASARRQSQLEFCGKRKIATYAYHLYLYNTMLIAELLQYDMLTTPITSSHFQTRVLALLLDHLEELKNATDDVIPTPVVGPLTLTDTPMSPGEIISQLIAVSSPWIDLSSPDPLIYNMSRQVLHMEMSYAAFCGVGNVIVSGPKLHYGKLHGEGVMQYALAIQEALGAGNYIQIHISMPMTDHRSVDEDDDMNSLAFHAREEFVSTSEDCKIRKTDVFGTWDAWNLIRTVCNYNSRLFVGKRKQLRLHNIRRIFHAVFLFFFNSIRTYLKHGITGECTNDSLRYIHHLSYLPNI